MKLFNELQWQRCAPRPHRIETPLGAIASRALVDGSGLDWAGASFFAVTGSNAWGARWDAGAGAAEVLVARPRLVVDYHVAVAACWAFLWRFVAAREAAIALETGWDGEFAWTSGGPASGEHLDAIEWDDGRTQVTLGTQAGDAQFSRAERDDWLPRRFLASARGDLYDLDLNLYSNTGLTVDFGPAHAGEKFAAHFAVAWADYDSESIAPWLAVDTSAAQIIAGARGEST